MSFNAKVQRALINQAVEQTKYENHVLKTIEADWRPAREAIDKAIREGGLFHLNQPGGERTLGIVDPTSRQTLAAILDRVAAIVGSMVLQAMGHVGDALPDFGELELKELPKILNRHVREALASANLHEAFLLEDADFEAKHPRVPSGSPEGGEFVQAVANTPGEGRGGNWTDAGKDRAYKWERDPGTAGDGFILPDGSYRGVNDARDGGGHAALARDLGQRHVLEAIAHGAVRFINRRDAKYLEFNGDNPHAVANALKHAREAWTSGTLTIERYSTSSPESRWLKQQADEGTGSVSAAIRLAGLPIGKLTGQFLIESSRAAMQFIRTGEAQKKFLYEAAESRTEAFLFEYIVRLKGGYRIISHRTGKNLGTFKTRAAAQRHLRHLAKFREAQQTLIEQPEDDVDETFGSPRLFPEPAPALLGRNLFRSVPEAQVSAMLASPIGGSRFAQSFADLGTSLLTRLRNILTGGLIQGSGIVKVAKLVQNALGNARYAAERIVRSEFVRTAAQADLQVYSANEESLEGAMWVATLDQATCLACGELDGEVFYNIDDAPIPVDDTHPNCFLPGTRVSGSFLVAVRFLYSGRVVTVKTKQGETLRVTPNHPILTARGMLPAHELREGDDVIRSLSDRGGEDHQDMPAPIEEVFRTLQAHGFWQPARLRQEYFHGDAVGGQGQIDVVALDRVLLHNTVAAFSEGRSDLPFELPDEGQVSHLSAGALDQFGARALDAEDGSVCGSGLSRALTRSHPRPFHALRFGLTANLHAVFLKTTQERGTRDARFVRELLERCPGTIALDQVVEIRYDDYTGHVYDLQSESGAIVAENTVTSNCRCKLVPIVKNGEDLGFGPGSRASMDGQVPATMTYQDWFDEQPEARQREILGPTRYRLYQQDDATLGDFVGTHGVKSVKEVLQDFAEALDLVEYSDDQPRVPAGSPEGGQWTDSGGGESGGHGHDHPVDTRPWIEVKTVSEAYARLTRGQRVALADLSQVATLLDRLATAVEIAKGSGRNISINLCDVSVTGTNVFCTDNKGIHRVLMPQFKGKPIPGSPADALPKERGKANIGPAFTDSLRAEGIAVRDEDVPAMSLKASQDELQGKTVAGMMQAMRRGERTSDRIFVSRDNYVIDGHHRWAATVGLATVRDRSLTIPVSRIDLPIMDVLVRSWAFTKRMGIESKGLYEGRWLLEYHDDAGKLFEADEDQDKETKD